MRRFTSLVWIPLALVLMVVLGACSSNTTPVATRIPSTPTIALPNTPTPPSGWSVRQGQGFQLALPSTWEELPLDDAALKGMIDTVSNDNPHLATLLSSVLASGQNKSLIFFAADKSPAAIVTNVTVTRTDLSSAASVDQGVRDYAQSLTDVLKGAKLVSFDTPLAVNGQKGGEVIYDLPLVNAAGQVVTVRGVQFLVAPAAGRAYIITVTGDASNGDQLIPLARQIGMSFLAK